MRILIVEDEKELALIIKKGLEENGYCVDAAYDGEEGLYLTKNINADTIILDISLPHKDGLEILKEIRKAGINTPVILLTSKDTVSDKIAGLDTGADDYLTKPFEFTELLARIRAVIRRLSQVKESIITIGDLKIDTASHDVYRAGQFIRLSAKEFALLEYLAYNKERVITRTEVTEHIYNEDFDMDSNIVDVYINFLRKKIDKNFKNKLIHTVRGTGYIIKEE